MAISATFHTPSAERISQNLFIITGQCDFGTAASGGLSTADISGKFKSCFYIGFAGNDGYVHQWDESADKVVTYEAGADGASLDQVTAGDVGECRFVAIGQA